MAGRCAPGHVISIVISGSRRLPVQDRPTYLRRPAFRHEALCPFRPAAAAAWFLPFVFLKRPIAVRPAFDMVCPPLIHKPFHQELAFSFVSPPKMPQKSECQEGEHATYTCEFTMLI